MPFLPDSPIRKRDFLAGACLLPLTAALPAMAADAPSRQRSRFGAAVQCRHILVDAGYRDAVRARCSAITPELEFKWDFVENDSGAINLEPADQLVAFAVRKGLGIHGHTLVWHKSTPAWAVQQILESRDWAIVRRFFTLMLPRFAQSVESWDVVNEPFQIGPRPDGLREAPFLRAFGPDYIRRAFEEAHQLAPETTLYLNEYGLLYNYPESVAKRQAVLALLERLRGANVPVDGLGIQAHLELGRMDAFDQEGLQAFLTRIAEMGLRFRISELDVAESETAIPVEQRDQRVAEATQRLLDVVSGHRALSGITCWGLSDRYSWLAPHNMSAGMNRGLPLDSDLREKPMFRAIERYLRPA